MIHKRDIRRTPLLFVAWDDATSASGWCDPTIRGKQSIGIVSVGWLLRKTKRELTIAQSISTNGRAGDVLTLPRGMIRHVRRLRP